MSAQPIEADVRPALDARPAPVDPGDRMFELDMLRGWAVLGILAVNAISFAWPFALMMDIKLAPFAVAGADRVGLWAVDVFFQDKFRSLFSMLFGVSVFLVGGMVGDAVKGRVLKRRLLWLGLIGLLHGALLWYGDILMHYAMCGLIVMTVRDWAAQKLVAVGGGVTLAWGVIAMGFGLMAAMGDAGGFGSMGDNPFAPSPEQIAQTIEAYRSGWPPALIQNLISWAILQGASLFLIPVTVPLMMLGLGLYKSGWLLGRGPGWTYAAAILAGAASLAWLGWASWGYHTDLESDYFYGMAQAASAFAPVITLAYAAMLILLARAARPLVRPLAPVGRMAFTNYLTQSLIMATLFYLPFGPRLFGSQGPAALWLIVGGIWVAQLIWSPLWLSVFRHGPLEWLWRCLTYGRMLPILKGR